MSASHDVGSLPQFDALSAPSSHYVPCLVDATAAHVAHRSPVQPPGWMPPLTPVTKDCGTRRALRFAVRRRRSPCGPSVAAVWLVVNVRRYDRCFRGGAGGRGWPCLAASRRCADGGGPHGHPHSSPLHPMAFCSAERELSTCTRGSGIASVVHNR